MPCLASKISKRVLALRAHKRASTLIWALTSGCQLLLLAKAVTVAVAGHEWPWPTPEHLGAVGLVYLYAAIVCSLASLSVLRHSAEALIKGWEEHSVTSRAEVTEPLLEKGAADAGQEGADRRGTITLLLHYSSYDLPLLLLAFSAGAVAALGQALIPFYTGRIIDYASIDPDVGQFEHTIVLLILVSLGCSIFTGIRGGFFTVCMAKLNVRIRTRLFDSLLAQELGYFDCTNTGEITSRLSADTTTVADQICLNLNVALRSLTQAAMVLVFMFDASWRLTIITFISIPCVILLCKVYGEYYRELSKAVQTELANANSVAEEALSSMATVKAHAAETSTRHAYQQRLRAFAVLQLKEALAYGAYAATNTFLPNVVNAVTLFYGGRLVLDGRMSAGALVSFMLYQQSLNSAFQALGDVFSSLSAAVGAADKVIEMIKRVPKVPAPGSLAPSEFSGRVELQNVDFSYPARPSLRVLNGVSLQINPGEVVALVGPSGGGKSSIVKLVERFYLPSNGLVLLDGRDVGVYDPHWLRRRVALVSQEPVLYARSVRRNILYGLEEDDGEAPGSVPSPDEVEQAARLANAHSFISDWPQGYETDCGEKGTTISGGQRQRLAIARALVRRPSVLLLDEATSALDADSEAVVQEALDRLMKEHTVLVIAHRLSTVMNADRIVVVAEGAVQAVGTHEALLEAGGLYANLVRKQLAGSAAGSSASLRAVTSSASLQPFSPSL
ncbi:hypothetical protein WJX81_005691 [Elliptochloris bilobata]|uniref:Uncharacterized protein n=1 Tax=Elliptochloris bilobata TaxID=381761 RepID=A0AAW1SJC1_9CHLO